MRAGAAHVGAGGGRLGQVAAGDQRKFKLSGAGKICAIIQYASLVGEQSELCGNRLKAGKQREQTEPMVKFKFHGKIWIIFYDSGETLYDVTSFNGRQEKRQIQINGDRGN